MDGVGIRVSLSSWLCRWNDNFLVPMNFSSWEWAPASDGPQKPSGPPAGPVSKSLRGETLVLA